ncbi:uncharacterized protein LOC108092459 [Drosophila ficusphila]|uniref:uncharacterized protein LOC108092459 n=1 Tax=Drosophila ficusphila TaxID=30025 RepID=UPI0007E86E26|nr:uncharacterized protein LOC108092459 [Drosophila ficusphila]
MGTKEEVLFEDRPKISTFAVLDLETTNLPVYNNNRVGITELCIYAFEAALLKKDVGQDKKQEPVELPDPPRVVHKLNLLFQPSMMVHPDSESITGLSNYLLERESKLDGDSAQLIVSFLKHLPAPVCLVAHNGWNFDFPIMKKIFQKLNVELPESITCLDSLRAFLEIDDNRFKEQNLLPMPEITHEPDSLKENETAFEESEPAKETDWRSRNETTPKRPIVTQTEASVKRRRLADDEDDLERQGPVKRESQVFRSRRKLFSGLTCAETKRFPPRNVYKLENLFTRKFQQPAGSSHQAEADVVMLMKLILHYGMDFLAFAEEQAIPFHKVLPLGVTAR